MEVWKPWYGAAFFGWVDGMSVRAVLGVYFVADGGGHALGWLVVCGCESGIAAMQHCRFLYERPDAIPHPCYSFSGVSKYHTDTSHRKWTSGLKCEGPNLTTQTPPDAKTPPSPAQPSAQPPSSVPCPYRPARIPAPRSCPLHRS